MKNIALTLLLAFACLANKAATKPHFITDDAYRAQVELAFRDKCELLPAMFTDSIALLQDNSEREALQFLYAYMPLADITDHPMAFHLANVRAAFQARREMAWGGKVPELLFRHFVLPVRVNNEALDLSRVVFFEELKKRVRGMGMYDAIIEVNHWCHEHVTYQPSDGRTLSPLACMKNAIGRCGEESTYTVAALRSIGIPARQVYTPRWAHTDDNHAWVEAWADGKWYFLGACEPEPVLDLGWFNAPASRAMLMHTRAFGDYNGPEEVMLRTNNFTEINLIDNYAQTARIDFRVTDADLRPIEGARVDFKIYNYAEFNTVATKYTNSEGKTFLTAGKGDMLVWASTADGRYGYAKASFGNDKEVGIQLSRDSQTDATHRVWPADSLNIVPPAEHANYPKVADAAIAENKRRLAQEDSIRKAYEKTFITPEQANHYSPRFAPFMLKARGNWETIVAFIKKHIYHQDRVFNLLSTLSDKDLQDMPMEILDDHFNSNSSQLCPRVENEMITLPFKQNLERAFDTETTRRMQADPRLLVQWVRDNIRLNPDQRALRIAQTPMGVWHSRLTDTRSRDIFFVDLARSLDIEARKDVVTGKVQYRQGEAWQDVDFDHIEKENAETGTLVLQFTPDAINDDPHYYSQFTIARIHQGQTQLLNFEEGQVDMGGGTSWSNTFKEGTPLDAGTYMLTTGTRLANGSVLASNQIFNILPGEQTTLQLSLRQAPDEVSVIGSFDSESLYMKEGQEVSLLSQTGRGYYLLGILGIGQEPTNHALRDICKEKAMFDGWERPIVLLTEEDQPTNSFNPADYGTWPERTLWGTDKGGRIKQQLIQQLKLGEQPMLPIFVIADTFNRVVYVSQGYTIGIGEQLGKVIKKL